jgi:glycosyltransferase involved in cell wall biosynthesis
LPVVAFGIPGIDEVVVDGGTGMTVPVGKPALLADGLAGLVGDEELRRRLGSAAQKRIHTEFGFTEYVDKLSGLYHRATKQGKGIEP